MEQLGITPYKTSVEHILDEQRLLELYYGLAVIKFREKLEQEGRQLEDSGDIEKIYKTATGFNDSSANPDQYQKIRKVIGEQKRTIERRREASAKEGKMLLLQHIVNKFGLSEFEKNIILVCMAPELDSKFERLNVYLQNDSKKKIPAIGLILDLFLGSKEEKILSRRYFLDTSQLFKFGLVHFEEGQKIEPLPSRLLKMDPHISNFILGQEELDPRLQTFSKLVVPTSNIDDNMEIYGDLKKYLLEDIQQAFIRKEAGISYYLQGPSGVGKKTAIYSICKNLKISLLVVDTKSAIGSGIDYGDLATLLLRDSLILNAALYLDNFDTLFENQEESDKTRYRLKELITFNMKTYGGLAFLSGQKPLEQSMSSLVTSIQFQLPDYETRKKLWHYFLGKNYSDVKIDTIAEHFKFTPLQIKQAIQAANKYALKPDEKNSVDFLYRCCYMQCNQNLGALAKKIAKKFSLNDIVLPEDKKAQLKEIISYVKNRNLVFGKWGFGEKQLASNGLNILFAGESGTGKTMAASIIANELGLEMYKIDLASVVSKYIGETEKNLNRIFHEAETSNVILFFDEADALFGKRTDVKDAHDRYANVEVNYLLQKLEEHTEIVILASNFSQNIDSAFTRRMHFWVEFEFPDEQNRLEIWRDVFPQNAPLSKDMDLEFMAHQFKITGGHIKNIAFTSAFLAAEESSDISMKHLILATKREFQKLGKPITKSDFVNYHI